MKIDFMASGKCYKEEEKELSNDELDALYQDKLDRDALEIEMLDSYHW